MVSFSPCGAAFATGADNGDASGKPLPAAARAAASDALTKLLRFMELPPEFFLSRHFSAQTFQSQDRYVFCSCRARYICSIFLPDSLTQVLIPCRMRCRKNLCRPSPVFSPPSFLPSRHDFATFRRPPESGEPFPSHATAASRGFHMTSANLVQLLGGVGLFLFAIRLISESLQMLAGDKMRQIIGMLTRTPLLGVIV